MSNDLSRDGIPVEDHAIDISRLAPPTGEPVDVPPPRAPLPPPTPALVVAAPPIAAAPPIQLPAPPIRLPAPPTPEPIVVGDDWIARALAAGLSGGSTAEQPPIPEATPTAAPPTAAPPTAPEAASDEKPPPLFGRRAARRLDRPASAPAPAATPPPYVPPLAATPPPYVAYVSPPGPEVAPPVPAPPVPAPPVPAPATQPNAQPIPTAGPPDGGSSLLDANGRLFSFAPPRSLGREANRLRGMSVALKTLLRQRRRMLLSIVAVALGVGYLAGSLSLLQRVGAGLAAQAGADSERADLVVEGVIASDGPLQQVRKLVPDSNVAAIREIPGVAAVEPRLESKSTLIIGLDGTPVIALGLTERPLGANYPADPGLNPYRFVGDGRAPTKADEIVIDAGSAKAAGVKVGDKVGIASKVTTELYTVTGIVEMAEGRLPAGSSLALFELDTARTLFELGPDNNAIAIRLDDDADPDEVTERIEAVLFAGAEVSTGAEYSQHRQASLEKSFTLIRALLVGFAGLALVVGSFTVANSMALLFDHRRRGFAMLRLMGGAPGQLVAAATTEAVIGGVIAGVIGLALGLGVGAGIEQLIQSMGTPLPVAGPALTWWIPVVAILVGATVTVLTALSPARHASRTPPVHAVTGADDRPEDRGGLLILARWAATVAVMGAGAALAGLALAGTQIALIAGGAGAAIALVLVVLPRLLSGIVGFVTTLLLGRSIALKRMSSLRSRQARTRSASTTAALLLAAAVVTSLTVLSSSFLESVEGQVTSSIDADLIVDSGTFTNGGLSSDLIPALREQPGVDGVSGWRPGQAYIGTPLWRAGGLDGASMFQLLNLDVDGLTPTSFGIGDVVISEDLAASQNLELGQVVPVAFQNGAVVQMTVKAIFRSQLSALLGDIIVDATVMAANLPQSNDVLAFVNLSDDAPADAQAQITKLAKSYGATSVLEPTELVSKRAELLRGFSRVIQWMLTFSIILALIGVANTLQLGVNERRRELGLLRSVGATRRQVLRLVMAEAAALSLVGTLMGMAVGLGAAYATVNALSDFGLDQFVAPTGALGFVAVVAIGLGLIGAIVPALRASKIPLLDAISDSGGTDTARRRLRRANSEATRSPAAPAAAPAAVPPAAAPPAAAPPTAAPAGPPMGAGADTSVVAADSPRDYLFAARNPIPPPNRMFSMGVEAVPTPLDSTPEHVNGSDANADHLTRAGFSSSATEADPYGLAAAVRRLAPRSQEYGKVPFSIAGALLGPGERVLGAVAGTSLGMATVVIVTDDRAIVVSDRRYVPDVEIFELAARPTVHGREANDQASLTFGDHERLITVDQITDIDAAVALATAARRA